MNKMRDIDLEDETVDSEFDSADTNNWDSSDDSGGRSDDAMCDPDTEPSVRAGSSSQWCLDSMGRGRVGKQKRTEY